jgi:hypothetical protein
VARVTVGRQAIISMGRHFFNPGAPTGRSFADFLRWQRTRRASPWPQWRANPPVAAAPGAPAADEMAVTFINHVTFLIQLPGLNILTDPVYCERASPVQWAGPRRVHAPGLAWQQLPALDLVFVSHNHYDHMDLSTLRRLRQAHAPLFLTGLGNASFLRQQGITPGGGARLVGADLAARCAADLHPGPALVHARLGHQEPYLVGRAVDRDARAQSVFRCRYRLRAVVRATAATIAERPRSPCCRSAPMSRAGSCAIST